MSPDSRLLTFGSPNSATRFLLGSSLIRGQSVTKVALNSSYAPVLWCSIVFTSDLLQTCLFIQFISYFMKIDVVGGASSHIFQLGNSFLRLLSSYNGWEIISQEIMKYKLFLKFYSKDFSSSYIMAEKWFHTVILWNIFYKCPGILL